MSLFSHKGQTHRLEITPPLLEPHAALRLADLTSEEEEGLHGRIGQYERKIESLLTQVGSLKNEVSLLSSPLNPPDAPLNVPRILSGA